MRQFLCVTLLAAMAAPIGGCSGAGKTAPRPAPIILEPDTSGWQTWVLPSPDAVRVPAPRAPAVPSPEAAIPAPSSPSAGALPVLGAEWLELAMDYVSQRTKDPPAASRAYALVTVAGFDALVAARYWAKHYPGSGGYPSDEAAVAGAASRVLAYLFPEQPALRLDEMAERSAPQAADGPRQAGLTLGRAVADKVIEHAEADGSDRPWDGTRPPNEAAYWSPPPGSVSPPVQPLAGAWKTWVIGAGDAFRPPPPPVYGSPPYLAEAQEVIDLGNRLTGAEKSTAKFWEGGDGTPLPPGIWNRVVIDYLEEHPVSRADQVKTLALVNVAMADSGVAAWDAKYTYWTPRPENAIRDLIDPSWSPYLRTPLFPAYVSGHSAYSAAVATVLAGLFPAGAQRFLEMGEEAGRSRLLGGIHFRSDHVEGTRMGREIGRKVLERAARLTLVR